MNLNLSPALPDALCHQRKDLTWYPAVRTMRWEVNDV